MQFKGTFLSTVMAVGVCLTHEHDELYSKVIHKVCWAMMNKFVLSDYICGVSSKQTLDAGSSDHMMPLNKYTSGHDSSLH